MDAFFSVPPDTERGIMFPFSKEPPDHFWRYFGSFGMIVMALPFILALWFGFIYAVVYPAHLLVFVCACLFLKSVMDTHYEDDDEDDDDD